MITLPLVALLGAATFLIIKYGRASTLGAVICVAFGVLLAGTTWGQQVSRGIGITADITEDVANGATK